MSGEKYPDDLDVRSIFVEAIMNETPWQMWDLAQGFWSGIDDLFQSVVPGIVESFYASASDTGQWEVIDVVCHIVLLEVWRLRV